MFFTLKTSKDIEGIRILIEDLSGEVLLTVRALLHLQL